jgi:hypothetical protein
MVEQQMRSGKMNATGNGTGNGGQPEADPGAKPGSAFLNGWAEDLAARQTGGANERDAALLRFVESAISLSKRGASEADRG